MLSLRRTMIRQISDLLEINDDGTYSLVDVLTRVVTFGGNIIFAFHTDDTRHASDVQGPGFRSVGGYVKRQSEISVTKTNLTHTLLIKRIYS